MRSFLFFLMVGRAEYFWADPARRTKKMETLTANEYVRCLFGWFDDVICDSTVFPKDYGLVWFGWLGVG